VRTGPYGLSRYCIVLRFLLSSFYLVIRQEIEMICEKISRNLREKLPSLERKPGLFLF